VLSSSGELQFRLLNFLTVLGTQSRSTSVVHSALSSLPNSALTGITPAAHSALLIAAQHSGLSTQYCPEWVIWSLFDCPPGLYENRIIVPFSAAIENSVDAVIVVT